MINKKMKLLFSIWEVLNQNENLQSPKIMIKYKCSADKCCIWREVEYCVCDGKTPCEYLTEDEELLEECKKILEPMIERNKLTFSVDV